MRRSHKSFFNQEPKYLVREFIHHPKQLTEEDKQNLYWEFTLYPKKVFWRANKPLKHDPDLYLPFSIIKREGKNTPKFECYYTFKNNIIGEGGSGTVYNINATLKLNHEAKTVNITFKNRVVKFESYKKIEEKYKKHNPNLQFQNEYDISSEIPYLKAKKPVIRKSKKTLHYNNKTINVYSGTCHFVLEKLPGKDFFEFIASGRIENLTYEERIDIAIALVERIKQLHDKGIIHGDLKPENILYDEINNLFFPIDFASGIKKGQNINKNLLILSFCYSAPELYKVKLGKTKSTDIISEQVDVWSIGRILSILFLYFDKVLLKNPREVAHPIQYFHQDSTMADAKLKLPEKFKSMEFIIKPMLHENPKNRPSLDETLKALKALKALKFCKNNIKQPFRPNQFFKPSNNNNDEGANFCSKAAPF